MILLRFVQNVPYTLGLQNVETEANRITILHVCETKTAIAAHTHTHTHTSFCDHLEKISLLCMAGVTSIQEKIIEKHCTEEEGIYMENNAEPP